MLLSRSRLPRDRKGFLSVENSPECKMSWESRRTRSHPVMAGRPPSCTPGLLMLSEHHRRPFWFSFLPHTPDKFLPSKPQIFLCKMGRVRVQSIT